MKPLLAHIHEDHRVDWNEQVWLQPKLNGVRALSQGGFFQSRDELPWAKGFLAHLERFMKDAFPPDLILDGELYVHGWPLQRINQAVAVNAIVRGANADTPFVQYHIFDCVSYNLTFEERFMKLRRYVSLTDKASPVQFVKTILCGDLLTANDFYACTISQGYEGIMYRLGHCPYTLPKQPGGSGRRKFLSDKNNRVWHMLKRKDWHDDEFECIGVDEGIGKREGRAGALICRCPNGKTFGVGSGLTDAEAEYYLANPPVGRQIKVKFLCYTSDGIPFNPIVMAVL